MKQRFEVEWCSHLPVRDGEADIDNAVYETEYFSTLAEAVTRAKSLIDGTDAFGSVRVTDERFRRVFGRMRWTQWADMMVDDQGAEYGPRDWRTIEQDDDDA